MTWNDIYAVEQWYIEMIKDWKRSVFVAVSNWRWSVSRRPHNLTAFRILTRWRRYQTAHRVREWRPWQQAYPSPRSVAGRPHCSVFSWMLLTRCWAKAERVERRPDERHRGCCSFRRSSVLTSDWTRRCQTDRRCITSGGPWQSSRVASSRRHEQTTDTDYEQELLVEDLHCSELSWLYGASEQRAVSTEVSAEVTWLAMG